MKPEERFLKRVFESMYINKSWRYANGGTQLSWRLGAKLAPCCKVGAYTFFTKLASGLKRAVFKMGFRAYRKLNAPVVWAESFGLAPFLIHMAWSSYVCNGIVSACGAMGCEIESRQAYVGCILIKN
jgi:hypothetical protein